MDSNPLDALIDRMGWINNNDMFIGVDTDTFAVYLSARERDELRRLLAVVKAARAVPECYCERGCCQEIREAMSTAAEVPHGQ